MAVSHVKSVTIPDFAGAVTVLNSNGSTTTANATDIVRPSDWNSQHNQFITIAGNTLGQSTLSGTNIVLAGGNNLTLSANGSTLSFVGPSGGGAAISAAGSSQNAGTVVLSNSNNVSFGMAGSTVTASASFPAQTQFVLSNSNGLTFGTNASTVTASYNSTQFDFASNTTKYAGTGTSATNASITLNSNGLAISVAAPGGAASVTAYAQSNTTQSSSGTMPASSLQFAGAGIISVGVSGGSVVISGPGSTVLPQISVGNSNLGNTLGNSGVVTGQLVLVGTNNITLSGSTNAGSMTISISGGAGGGGVALQNSQTTYTSGTVVLTEGGGAITIASSTPQQFRFSVPATSSLSATGNASISTNASTISIGANAAAVSIGGNSTSAGAGYSNISTGTAVLIGGNNITLSQNGASITISGPNAGGAQTGISGIVVSNTTYTSGTVSFSNANGISFGSSAGQAITASGNWITTARASTDAIGLNTAQTNVTWTVNSSGLSFNAGGYAGTGYTSTTTAGTAIVATHNTAGLSLAFPTIITNAITTARASTDAIGLNTAQTNVTWTVNSSGLSLNAAGYAGTGTSATNASITLNSNGLAISVAAPGAGGGIALAASNTTFTSGTVVISNNGGALTISSGAQSVLFSVPATSSLVGVNGISIATAGSTISVSNNQYTGSWWQPELVGATATITQPNGTVMIRPFALDAYYDVDKIDMYQSFASSRTTASFSASVSNASSSSGTGTWGLTGTWLIFSRVNTNETNASYNSIITQTSNTYSYSAGYSASVSWNANVSSATASVTTQYSIGFPATFGTDGAVTYGNTGTTGTTSFSSTSTNQNSFSSSFGLSGAFANMSGLRAVYMPAGSLGTTAMTPGEYWLGNLQSTATGSTNMPLLASCILMSDAGHVYFSSISQTYQEIGNSVAFTTSGMRPMFGSYSSSGNTTTAIALSQISSMASNAARYFALDGRSK